MIRRFAVPLVLLLLASPAASQSGSGADHYLRLVRARAAFDQRRFGEAADLYRDLAAGFPRDGELWLSYSIAADSAGRRDEALAALEKVVEYGAGYRPGATIKLTSLDLADRTYASYQIAQGHARLGHKEIAFRWLEKALAWGFTPRTMMQTDSAFTAFRDDPAFRRLAGLPPLGARPGRAARWRYDIDFLVAEAQRLHASFNREAFSPPFLQAAAGIKSRVGELTDTQIQVELQRLITLLRDGHSRVLPFIEGEHWLQLQFYWFSDGLFVIDGEGDAKSAIGSRVVRIGPVDAAELKARIAVYLSRDNPMGIDWTSPVYLAQTPFLQAIGATTDPRRITLTLRGQDGRERELVLAPGKARLGFKLVPPMGDIARAPLYLRQVDTNYWFTRLPDVPAVYAQFNQIIPARDLTIADYAAQLRGALADTAVRALILDVRHNNGGNSYFYPPLLRVMAAFEEASPDHRLYVLAGRNTFSAAQNFSTSVDRLTNAIFVGEPTGASPRFTGEGAIWFDLPYSRLKASISNWYHQFTFWADNRLWIAPDVPVSLSSADYFAGRDPALDAIVELIRREGR